MSNKFNGRIQQKHGTASEWSLATNFKPLEGELIVYDATSEQPYPRFKVGDGINFVNDLPFSDKEVWAALENKQPLGDYATKDEIPSTEGLATEIYVTQQIAAIPTPDVSGQISAHNSSSTAHSDIRNAIPTKTSDLTNDSGFLTQHQSLAGYAKTSDITSHNTSTTAHSDIRNAIPTKVSQLTNDSGYLTQHQSLADYAKTSDLTSHNTNASAHNDIRLLVTELTNRLNALANSDDTTLDQMSEIVAYIKNNKSLIDGVTTGKVNVSDIINNLTTNVSNKPLSAAQGVALKALIDAKAAKSDLTGLATETYVQNMIETSIVGGEW